MTRYHFKKSLGQHLLLNPTTIDSILKKAHLNPEDQVLEIGPGPGIMTEKIAKQAKRLVAVEKDHHYFNLLREKLGRFENITVVEADFLSLDLEKLLGGGKWKVIANLPYNIATEVIFHLLEVSSFFSSFYLMVQKEVALRLAAVPGSKNYGILSIFSQLLSKNRIVMKLPPGAFTPRPKIHSALVEFLIQEIPPYDIHHLPTFEAAVQAAFNQRRKMVRNALLSKFSRIEVDSALEKTGIVPTRRAEEIAIEEFVRLANFLQIS